MIFFLFPNTFSLTFSFVLLCFDFLTQDIDFSQIPLSGLINYVEQF